MVVKMMRWRPWPPLVSRKYEVRVAVRRLEGCCVDAPPCAVEIRWKGARVGFRRTVRRDLTKEGGVCGNGVVCWEDEEFQSACTLSGYKENFFHPWAISFAVLNGLNQGAKTKVPVIGTATMNLAEFASKAEEESFDLTIPLVAVCPTDRPPLSLSITVSLLELKAGQEPSDSVHRSIVPTPLAPSPPPSGESMPAEKDELSALKAGLRKVKIFTEYVSARRAKKACRDEEGSSSRSEDGGEYTYPFDSDSLDEFEEGESDEVKEDHSVRKSFSYGTLAYANFAGGGGSFASNKRINGGGDDEDWVYYSNRKSDVGCSRVEEPMGPGVDLPVFQTSKRSILPWRKRKLSFRSPKAKGEPLLKKGYGEEGGDDIDFDRRQLSSDESLFGWNKTDEDASAHRSSMSEFGDDNFAIGSWEQKEFTCRDGHMKLQTQVFFASIDQRSERAAGESACTALVAVVADWFQNNRDHMPIRSQFDGLIRDGSSEWRNLCANESYMLRFPDKHFDLETVIQAKIRPLAVNPGKSFVGFFHPPPAEGMDEGRFDFLQGAMSFDNIWDEINHGEPQIYIVSWNDHFFVLKVENEAYYIIDTLGERLHEGCNQAYILKFDKSTTIFRLPAEEKPASTESKTQPEPEKEESRKKMDEAAAAEEVIVCKGKETCKEYIKSFLAAIPIRELQADMKKGLMASTPLHQRLQIEFHYTQVMPPLPLTLPPPLPLAEAPAITEVVVV